MSDRFKLEDQITKVGITKDSLDLVADGLENHTITTDEAIDAMRGLSVVLELITMGLFDTFKQVFELDEYRKEVEIKPNKKSNRHKE